MSVRVVPLAIALCFDRPITSIREITPDHDHRLLMLWHPKRKNLFFPGGKVKQLGEDHEADIRFRSTELILEAGTNGWIEDFLSLLRVLTGRESREKVVNARDLVRTVKRTQLHFDQLLEISAWIERFLDASGKTRESARQAIRRETFEEIHLGLPRDPRLGVEEEPYSNSPRLVDLSIEDISVTSLASTFISGVSSSGVPTIYLILPGIVNIPSKAREILCSAAIDGDPRILFADTHTLRFERTMEGLRISPDALTIARDCGIAA